MKHATVIVQPGAIITCPYCHARIGVIRKPVYQHWSFGLDCIRFEKGQERRQGNKQATCNVCGASFAEQDRHYREGALTVTLLVHTDFGWLPRPPPNIPPPKRPPLKPAA